MIRRPQATQAGQEAKFEADTRIAEAQRDYQSNVAQYQAAGKSEEGEAGPGLRFTEVQDRPTRESEEIQVSIIENKSRSIAAAGIMRSTRARGQCAKAADAERYKVETLAAATKFQLETEAAGAAAAAKAKGLRCSRSDKSNRLRRSRGEQSSWAAEAPSLKLKAQRPPRP